MDIPEIDEAELKVATTLMYKEGGVANVLACVHAMQQCQIIIMIKLNEILDEENRDADKRHE